MWIKRDFLDFVRSFDGQSTLPIKVLKGPRQVGKTSLLDQLGTHKLVLLDDLATRNLARENPSLFLDQFPGPIVLDEATLAPELFLELKKRVDAQRRLLRAQETAPSLDVWVTGSNQTLLQRSVRESLAGRASYFTLNTLSVHELKQYASGGDFNLEKLLLLGGWPELYASPKISAVNYLNDFISTFIEKDIVAAAGIEKKASFGKMLGLLSGRVGQLLNLSDIARGVGAESSTVHSWVSLLEENGILRVLQPYFTNLNKRLIKTPKAYFEDTGLAVRFQGWSQFAPLLVSPYLGGLLENLALSEISRFFTNRGESPDIYFVRSKEQVEVDFLIRLPNERYIAGEVKATAGDFTSQQLKLLDSLKLNIVEKWMLTPKSSLNFANARVVAFDQIFDNLARVLAA